MIVERDLPDHPKTLKLARLLSVDDAAVVVMMIRLWGHCEARRTDVLGDADDIASILRWRGKSKRLMEHLLTCRWIDEGPDGYVAHGWREKNKEWLAKVEAGKKRARDAKRTADGQLASSTAGSLPPATLPASSQLAGEHAGGVEYSGVEKSPIAPLPGAVGSVSALVSDAIDRLNLLFGRKKRYLSADAMHWLTDMAMKGALPLPDEDWQALTAFYARRKNGEKMWRVSVEAVAKELLGEIDKAKVWLREFAPEAAKKPPAPEPPGWREWFLGKFPEKTPPSSFHELPDYLRDDARKELAA